MRFLLVLWGVLAVGCTVLLALGDRRLPDPVFWGAVGIVGLSAGLDKFAVAVRHKWRSRRDKIEIVLKAALVQLYEKTSIPILDLGVHAFRVGWRFRLNRLPIRKELVRVGQYSLQPRPRSNIAWTKGKGVIGKLWEEDVPAYGADMSNLLEIDDVETWGLSGAEDTTGLLFEEFRRTRRYSSIFAVPIQSSTNRFRGCVSIDAPRECLDRLDENQQVLHDASVAIWKLVERRGRE